MLKPQPLTLLFRGPKSGLNPKPIYPKPLTPKISMPGLPEGCGGDDGEDAEGPTGMGLGLRV